MAHLSPAQLAAVRDGERIAPDLTQHLAECAECQARLVEARRLAAALTSLSSETVQSHPSDLALTAYVENTLSPRNQRRVAEHVSSCSRCAKILAAVRSALSDE